MEIRIRAFYIIEFALHKNRVSELFSSVMRVFVELVPVVEDWTSGCLIGKAEIPNFALH